LALLTAGIIQSLIAGDALQDHVAIPVAYSLGDKEFEGQLVYHPEAARKASEKGVEMPGIYMVPNWMGMSDEAIEKAKGIAGKDSIIFVADVYGVDVRPENSREASAAAGQLRSGKREALRNRAAHGLSIFKKTARDRKLPVDPGDIVGIGFCFGGGAVLEMARSGLDIKGVVSFHGNLDTGQPAQSGDIHSRILVLHGADDPFVPLEDVNAFKKEMAEAGPDWQMVTYGNTVHSFTNPHADSEGARYHPQSSRRAFTAMRYFIEELERGSE